MNLDKHSDPILNTEPSASTNIKKLSITRRVSGNKQIFELNFH